jgi:hypothetical protein
MLGSIYFHVPGKLNVRNAEISWFHTFSSEQCRSVVPSLSLLAHNFFRVPTRAKTTGIRHLSGIVPCTTMVSGLLQSN